MRVLWFTDWQPQPVRRRLGLPDFPGPQAWVDALARLLNAQAGVELAIATPGERPFAPFEEDGLLYLDVPGARPARSRVARVARGWRHRLPPHESLVAAAALVREREPDIVHVHGTEGAFGLLASHLAPVPFVISLQGILSAYEQVYFAGRSRREIARLIASAEFLKGRGVVHRYVVLRRQARREACILHRGRWFIGRTEWDRRMLADRNPGAQYFHCDEVIRPEFYTAQWGPSVHGGPTIYSTSSAMLGKGTECLLAALGILRARGLPGVRLRIAGVEPGSEVDGLYRNVARRLGVERQVEWLGRLGAAGVVAELRRADVFAYPSHVDNSPNAVVEAMLVGTPIVATRVGGIPTLIEDGDEGLLVERGDECALAAALLRVLGDRALAARLGAAARLTAQRRNAPSVVVARTTEVYAEVIAQARTSELSEGEVHTRAALADILGADAPVRE